MQVRAGTVSSLIITGFISTAEADKLARPDNITLLHIKACHVRIPDLIIAVLNNQ
jgi:hypothetical protein